MERYFILDNFNTWYDWNLILTAKDLTPPEPKTNYVYLDGSHGSIDLSEALTGETTYTDRTLTATFWTDYGSHLERERLLRNIISKLHGRKIKIIDPDDSEHYFMGRVRVSYVNNKAYADVTITATCEPWRYSIEDSLRTVEITGNAQYIVINNHGDKTLTPEIELTASAYVAYDDKVVPLNEGAYRLTDLKLRHGANVIKVSGSGSITIKYKEAYL